ncbi:MAG: hypothetical protein Q8P67_19630 [archaeon]|nr:hypothetical protein [archaeon]
MIAMKPKKKNPPPKPDPLPRDIVKPQVDIYINIIDRYKDYRGCIAQDGTCYNAAGDVIGYMDFTSGEGLYFLSLFTFVSHFSHFSFFL